jgi:hypothetical protein
MLAMVHVKTCPGLVCFAMEATGSFDDFELATSNWLYRSDLKMERLYLELCYLEP